MGIFFKTAAPGPMRGSEPDLMESGGRGWLRLLFWLIIISAALVLVWRAPSLNSKLFKNNKNMIPLTGSLWILILPEAGAEAAGKKLLKIAEPARAGAAAAPGMMYLSRFNDGLIRPIFFFDNLPQTGPADQPSQLPFRYQVDDLEERMAMGILQGRQVLMLNPVEGGFDDLGPELLAAAVRGRKLRVTLELQPDWIFEANYDVSEMGAAMERFEEASKKAESLSGLLPDDQLNTNRPAAAKGPIWGRGMV